MLNRLGFIVVCRLVLEICRATVGGKLESENGHQNRVKGGTET